MIPNKDAVNCCACHRYVVNACSVPSKALECAVASLPMKNCGRQTEAEVQWHVLQESLQGCTLAGLP